MLEYCLLEPFNNYRSKMNVTLTECRGRKSLPLPPSVQGCIWLTQAALPRGCLVLACVIHLIKWGISLCLHFKLFNDLFEWECMYRFEILYHSRSYYKANYFIANLLPWNLESIHSILVQNFASKTCATVVDTQT